MYVLNKIRVKKWNMIKKKTNVLFTYFINSLYYLDIDTWIIIMTYLFILTSSPSFIISKFSSFSFVIPISFLYAYFAYKSQLSKCWMRRSQIENAMTSVTASNFHIVWREINIHFDVDRLINKSHTKVFMHKNKLLNIFLFSCSFYI